MANIWVISGSVGLGMAVLGIILLILSTNPLLLLAVYCYGHGSKLFSHWWIDCSWVGGNIRSYRKGRGKEMRHKVAVLVLLWLAIGYAIGFGVTNWWLKYLLGIIAIGVTTHLIMIKTLRLDSPKKTEISEFVHPFEMEKF